MVDPSRIRTLESWIQQRKCLIRRCSTCIYNTNNGSNNSSSNTGKMGDRGWDQDGDLVNNIRVCISDTHINNISISIRDFSIISDTTRTIWWKGFSGGNGRISLGVVGRRRGRGIGEWRRNLGVVKRDK